MLTKIEKELQRAKQREYSLASYRRHKTEIMLRRRIKRTQISQTHKASKEAGLDPAEYYHEAAAWQATRNRAVPFTHDPRDPVDPRLIAPPRVPLPPPESQKPMLWDSLKPNRSLHMKPNPATPRLTAGQSGQTENPRSGALYDTIRPE